MWNLPRPGIEAVSPVWQADSEGEFLPVLFHLLALESDPRDFSGGPVVRIWCFHCTGSGFNPWCLTSHSAWPEGKKKELESDPI